MGEGGRGAVQNVDAAGLSGIRQMAAVSVNSATDSDAAAMFDVVGAGDTGSAPGTLAWRCFSQHGQAYVNRTCSITLRDAGS